MIITEIQNRQQAESFINSLNSFRKSGTTDRSYAVYLLFLVSGLELESANLIIESLNDIDKVSGPYIACHIFIDRIEVPTYETLNGVYKKKPIQNSKLNIKQIEGICKKGKVNHMEMNELKGSDLTSANELIAHTLGIADKVPCMVIFDSVEVVSFGTLTVMSFPKSRSELSKMLRGILGIINKGKFKENSLILEKIHTLFDNRKKLKTKLGAPLNHKIKVFGKVLKNLSTNPSLAKLEVNRVCKKLGIDSNLSKKQILLLSQSGFIDSNKGNKILTNIELNEIVLKFKIEFRQTLGTEELNTSYQNKLFYLRAIKEKVILRILEKIRNDHLLLQKSLDEINVEISNQVNQLKQGESIVKSIKRKQFLDDSVFTIKATLIDTIKSGIKELGKPSFWIKLFTS